MTVILKKIGKINGDTLTQDDIKIIDDNAQIIEDAINNGTTGSGDIIGGTF
jgi:hypothetical protein